jgi:copper homeostasis protein (lipoprotein)
MALIERIEMGRLRLALAASCVPLAACVLIGCTAPAMRPGGSSAGPRERAAAPNEPRRLLGLYRYWADAASFFDCTSGDQFPVAPDGEGPALQQAYTAARAVPGEPQLASVVARIVMRATEPGLAPRPALQIERVIALSAQTRCAAPAGAATLENTHWKLTSLRGQPGVPASERQREAHLILQTVQRRVVGSGGCNRLSGNYTLDGDRLTFARAAGTLMACRDGMEQERVLLDTLPQVARWRIEGQRLTLLDERGTPLLRFDALLLH